MDTDDTVRCLFGAGPTDSKQENQRRVCSIVEHIHMFAVRTVILSYFYQLPPTVDWLVKIFEQAGSARTPI